MNVNKINLEYVSKGVLNSDTYDGITHKKILPCLSVVQAVEGNYDIQIGNSNTFSTGEKGFFVAPSNVQQVITHNVDKNSGNMSCRWVFLTIKVNDNYNFDDLYRFPIILPEPFKSQMNSVFDRLFGSNDVFSEYICYHEIVRILSLAAEKKDYRMPSFLDRAIAFIEENYKEKITIEDIAKTVNISESYLFSAFKKQMGISPISYLNHYRLSVATELMRNTNKSITEISAEVGVYDSIYFNKLFRKCYQMSPSKYRRNHRM